MDSPKSNVWHLSRGIVFARDTRVVYPRLPATRYHSAPAVVSHSETLSNSAIAFGGLGDGQTTTEGSATADLSPPAAAEAPVADQAAAAAASEASEEPDAQKDTPPISEEDLKPPFTPLDFKIPDDVFREAKLAPEGSPESYWSYSMYRGPGEDGAPDAKIKVHYCTSVLTAERVLQQYFMDKKLLGFDLEWEPEARATESVRRNVSLVQIASEDRIALFHLALYKKDGKFVGPLFKQIMEDPAVTKTGVWIKGDCTRLRKFLNINSRGTLELSNLYKLVKYSTSGEYKFVNKKLVNMATQVLETMHLPLFKGQDTRSSSWSQPLKMNQIIYSASDAYAAVQLYAIMNHHRQNLDPTPPVPHFVEENKPISLADGIVLPTADEGSAEQETDKPEGETTTTGPVLSAKYLKSLGDTIKIENDDELSSEPILVKQPEPAPVQIDNRVVEATAQAADYRASRPPARTARASAALYQLRAYYLWHKNADLNPQQVAALLRDPPLQTMTVVNYILEAIRLEKLQYEKARMKAELLSLIPESILATPRYKTFVKGCEKEGKTDVKGKE
ncbi:exonuclease-like protein [Apodospora peruviana]|uniref:Exonuclease-like protein n=1 Tax=Apodospora peruviana TaxID=516989 RepID=A0AAE0IIK0_9PEZI|nr:exonuclease-like protein [Apodospora peruviana]